MAEKRIIAEPRDHFGTEPSLLAGGDLAEAAAVTSLEDEGFAELATAYLLGEMPEEEAERFEDEGFNRAGWLTGLRLAEEDLIDAYLREELTGERRRRFEEDYLTAEARRERVCMAAAILRHVDA